MGGFEPPALWSQTRCATKLRHIPSHLMVRYFTQCASMLNSYLPERTVPIVAIISSARNVGSSVIDETVMCVNTLLQRRRAVATRDGNGSPVVLVHGWMGRPVQLLSWLNCLDPNRPVYFYNYASVVPDIESASTELRVVLQYLTEQHNSLVMGAGHSLGGVLLAKAAQKETVSGYLTVCSPVRALREPPTTLELNVAGRYDFIVPASLAVRRGTQAYAMLDSGHLASIEHTSTLSALRFLDEQTS